MGFKALSPQIAFVVLVIIILTSVFYFTYVTTSSTLLAMFVTAVLIHMGFSDHGYNADDSMNVYN